MRTQPQKSTCFTNRCSNFHTLQPWIVCLSAALFFFYEFIQMSMFNSISSELMQDFHINATQLGNLSATYFYADVIFLLPAGMILDKLRVKNVILVSMVICILGTFLFSISNSALVAAICHFMAGIGNAFCFLSCIMLASRWFPPQRLALAIGLMVTLGMLGGVVAQTPFVYLVSIVGWRHAVMFNGFLGIAIFLLIFAAVQDFPSNYKKPTPHSDNHNSKTPALLLVFKNKQNWLGGLYTCLLNLPVFLLGQLWGNMYLTQVHGLTATEAASAAMMIFFGTMIGSPLIGWISDNLKSRRIPMIACAIISLVLISFVMFMKLSFLGLIILFLLLGIITSAQVIGYPVITESNPSHMTGTAMGLASVLIMGGGAVFQPFFGWLMDLNWDHTLVNGTAVYSSSNYLLAMMILPIAFGLGLLAAICLRETHCLSVKRN